MNTQSHLNPRIPKEKKNDDSSFDPVADGFRLVPWTYGDIGLTNDEFAYLVKGMLHTGNTDKNKNKHWWSYKKQAEDMKLGRSKISFINQLLENAGIIYIDREKGKSNIYRYRKIKPEHVAIFRSIVEEERAKLQSIYDSDGAFIHRKVEKGAEIIREGEGKRKFNKKAKSCAQTCPQ